ncbi:peptidyl-prolyl cis-trans isomerase D [Nilaparvata lugens]|uniref:peptidyl-prolyl cis-trans isomerase D n=1 Tax=Nilaparvata lugens TaxID=108931 RepID=UPI00193DC222|nr:peptidyl-prolyl cis-trans isomerase D [Nilaparvata lugens]
MNVVNNDNDNPFVYLDIEIDEEKVGRVVIELFKDKVPRTAENFRALCTGEKGRALSGTLLHYKGSLFHRVIPQLMIQGGDITNSDGSGGESIYGRSLESENFDLNFDEGGVVSMVSGGGEEGEKDEEKEKAGGNNEEEGEKRRESRVNGSQFFITVVPCAHLNGHQMVIGRVRSGLGVVRTVSQVPVVSEKTKMPLKSCTIRDCGELRGNEEEEWGVEDNDGYPPFPEDWTTQPEHLKLEEIKVMALKMKEIGNSLYKNNDINNASSRYKKVLRYITWYKKKYNSHDKSLSDIHYACKLNLAAITLKRKLYEETVDLCTEVLRTDTTNVKAYFRRGKAQAGLKNFAEAVADFGQVKRLDANFGGIDRDLRHAQNMHRSYRREERMRYMNMFRPQDGGIRS